MALTLCLAGLTAVLLHIRCSDAAREAARLAARGDIDAVSAALSVAPGSAVELRRDGGHIVARVSGRSPMLPGVVIRGEAVAAVEPGR